VTSDESRRFTDKEVAMVIREASEIDEGLGSDGRGGMSAEDLRQIASEVGISPEAISKAVDRLDQGSRSPSPTLSGAPSVHKAVHAVQGELNEDALGQLIRLVDEETASTGAISEALGSVRWTSGDRFHSMQVSLTPQDGETVIQVVEKVRPRLRRIFHLLPAAWGTMIAGGVLAAADIPAMGVLLGLVTGLSVGGAIGRVVWGRVSARSRERVERLAAELSRLAYSASKKGLIKPGK
jgi:hypothetical protein